MQACHLMCCGAFTNFCDVTMALEVRVGRSCRMSQDQLKAADAAGDRNDEMCQLQAHGTLRLVDAPVE